MSPSKREYKNNNIQKRKLSSRIIVLGGEGISIYRDRRAPENVRIDGYYMAGRSDSLLQILHLVNILGIEQHAALTRHREGLMTYT